MNSPVSELSFLFSRRLPTFLTDTLRQVLTEINSQVLKIPSFSYFLFLFAVVVAHVAVSKNLGLYVHILQLKAEHVLQANGVKGFSNASKSQNPQFGNGNYPSNSSHVLGIMIFPISLLIREKKEELRQSLLQTWCALPKMEVSSSLKMSKIQKTQQMCICALIRMATITNQMYAAYAPNPKQSSSEAEVQMGNFSTISETEKFVPTCLRLTECRITQSPSADLGSRQAEIAEYQTCKPFLLASVCHS